MPITYQETEFLLKVANDLADTEIGQALVNLSDKIIHKELTPEDEKKVSACLKIISSTGKIVAAARFMGRLDKRIISAIDAFNKSMNNYFRKISGYLKKVSPKGVDYSMDIKYPGPIQDEDIVSDKTMERKFKEQQSTELESLDAVKKYAEDGKNLLLSTEDDITNGILNWLDRTGKILEAEDIKSLFDKTMDIIGSETMTQDEIPGYVEYLISKVPEASSATLKGGGEFSTLQEVVSKRHPRNIVIRKIEDAWKALGFESRKEEDQSGGEVSTSEIEESEEKVQDTSGRKVPMIEDENTQPE